MIVTKSFDDSLFKVVPIEPSDIMKGASDFDVGMPGYDGSQYAIWLALNEVPVFV
jgi:hypothetical protein